MLRTFRTFRLEAVWLAALLATGVGYSALAPAAEARRWNCVYWFEYDFCDDFFVIDCVCVP